MGSAGSDDADEVWNWVLSPRADDQFAQRDGETQEQIASKLDDVVSSEWREPADFLEPLTGSPFQKLRLAATDSAVELDERSESYGSKVFESARERIRVTTTDGFRTEYRAGQFQQREGICLFEVNQGASVSNDESTHRGYSGLQSPRHVFLDCLTGSLDLFDDVDAEVLDGVRT